MIHLTHAELFCLNDINTRKRYPAVWPSVEWVALDGLRDKGLVKVIGEQDSWTYYTITEAGREYLRQLTDTD